MAEKCDIEGCQEDKLVPRAELVANFKPNPLVLEVCATHWWYFTSDFDGKYTLQLTDQGKTQVVIHPAHPKE